MLDDYRDAADEMNADEGAAKERTPSQERRYRQRIEFREAQVAADRDRAADLMPARRNPPLAQDYEKPLTEREQWWRQYIRDTPLPTKYETPYFMKDVVERPATYNFKSAGRNHSSWPVGCGESLLPGIYKSTSFIDGLEKMVRTYSFKTVGRSKGDFLNEGLKDKHIDISPCQYNNDTHSITIKNPMTKSASFKSQSDRRYGSIFYQKSVYPCPGDYEPRLPPVLTANVTSCFKSKTPRFKNTVTSCDTLNSTLSQLAPGPGYYESCFQYPQPSKALETMGRKHGLFFTPAVNVQR